MDKNSKMMHYVWNKTSECITTKRKEHTIRDYNQLISSLSSTGPHYSFVMDFYNKQIQQMSEGIKPILGLDMDTVTFDKILNVIHPDDIAFVAQAEKTAYDYIYQVLGKENIGKYKTSYNFRIKTTDGNQQLFNHQAIALTIGEHYSLERALVIHTNINHLTKHNNRKVHLIGLQNEFNIIELDVDEDDTPINSIFVFSKREAEVITLITLGLRSEEIATSLFISVHTVKNHRKNILRKANVKNTMELITKCLKDGLV